MDSEIYRALRSLSISQGLALPSTAGPWSEDELLLMLDRIDAAALSGGEQEAYDFAEAGLLPKNRNVIFNATTSLEAKGHTNPDDFTSNDQYLRHINETRPFVALDWDFFLTDHAYAFIEIPLTAQLNYMPQGSGDRLPQSSMIGSHVFGFNAPFFAGSSDFDFNFPYRTFAAFGGKGWSVQAGRERLSWGPGETGNYMIGSQVHYHNALRTAWYNDTLKYTYIISNFVHPQEYFDSQDGGYDTVRGAVESIRGLKLFIAHRLEWRTFGGRLGLALSEAIMYQSKDSHISFDVFFPTMLVHNLYRGENQNSLLTLEADFAFARRWNLYTQIGIDELAVPWAEETSSEDNAAKPNQAALMLGVKTEQSLASGMVYASFEASYTSPYLYLEDLIDGTNGDSFVVANRYHDGAGPLTFPEEFLGYRWGGDALVFNLQGGYRKFGSWNVEGRIMVMAHGTFDKWTAWKEIYASEIAFLTNRHRGDNYMDENADRRDAISYTTAFSLFGSYFLQTGLERTGLELYGQADVVWVIYPKNIKASPPATDVQLTLGVSYFF
ncbi:MAG: hypothetical protein LBU28_03810 [Spirochaetaceae bacterium]|nr:hypothetical protein [Spirochaetaceae bacterium]